MPHAAAVIARFAPSPTGLLHLGHAFSAVLGWKAAQAAGGSWLLRIEDIDGTRVRPGFIDAIGEDLAWLGLAPDAPPLLQSGRRAAHAAALARLEAGGFAYPCFCARADIAAAAAAPHGPAPPYPGTCRKLPAGAARARAAREPHAIRLAADRAAAATGPLGFVERGLEQAVDPGLAGDIVLARRDIGVGYMLAVVVDDAASGVTDIVRGRDLFQATHPQRLLQALLGLPAPRYAHHRLLLAEDGRRLAKRDHARTLASLRAAGVDGRALAARLADFAAEGPDAVFPL